MYMYAGYVKIMWSFAWMEHALGHSHYTCRQKIILILYRVGLGLFSFTNAGEMSENRSNAKSSSNVLQ